MTFNNTKEGLVRDVNISLRNSFPELREIFPVINNMILNGNNFKISIGYKEVKKSLEPYLRLEIFRCRRTYPSIIISRFITGLTDLTASIIDVNLKIGNVPIFNLDESNQIIVISFLDKNEDLGKYKVSLQAGEDLSSPENGDYILETCTLTLIKPFSELLFLNSAINSMFAKNYRCAIGFSHIPQLITQNNLVCLYIYIDSFELPSLTFQATIIKDSSEEKLSISKWNWLNFSEHQTHKYVEIKETDDNTVELNFSCLIEKDSLIKKQFDTTFFKS